MTWHYPEMAILVDATNLTISDTVYIGAGWGAERYISSKFQKHYCPNSIQSANIGFMSPKGIYVRQRSDGESCDTEDHIEVVEVKLTPNATNVETIKSLIQFCFQFHDPTHFRGHGPQDKEFRQRSYIFTTDEVQREIAEGVVTNLQDLIKRGKIRSYKGVTVYATVCDASEFYRVHEGYQEYFKKTIIDYSNLFIRFHNWPS